MKKLSDDGFYDYAGLIEKFLNKTITVHEFERLYLENYLAEKVPMSDALFDALDWLFAEVDFFTAIPIGADEIPEHSIDEAQLRESASTTLLKIRNLEKNNNLKRE